MVNKPFLFIITGASGVGKSTVCDLLFQNEREYIVMEGDLLWNEVYNTPNDGYQDYRELWLRVCAHISQIGKPVVLCGCATPDQFEKCHSRSLFSMVYYLAIVCSDERLERRMREGRRIADDNWIESSIHFNKWLMDHADKTNPEMQLLDTTLLSAANAAAVADKWIMECIAKN